MANFLNENSYNLIRAKLNSSASLNFQNHTYFTQENDKNEEEFSPYILTLLIPGMLSLCCCYYFIKSINRCRKTEVPVPQPALPNLEISQNTNLSISQNEFENNSQTFSP